MRGWLPWTGDGKSFAATGLGHDVVAAIDSIKSPAVVLSNLNEILAGNLLHVRDSRSSATDGSTGCALFLDGNLNDCVIRMSDFLIVVAGEPAFDGFPEIRVKFVD